MLLTPGSLLQQDRYWVEAILQEDDMVVSYRALHRNLDKHVVIQTLGRALHQHPKADQLRHDFLSQVRQQTQQQKSTARVIDCFVEGNAPFVVLDWENGQALPEMDQWIPNLAVILEGEPQAIADATPTAESISTSPTAFETPVPSIGEPEPHSGASKDSAYSPDTYHTQPPTSPMADVTVAVGDVGSHTNGSVANASTTTPAAKSYSRVPSTTQQVGTRSKRSLWIPVSLLLTAIVGGCGGAYLGWQIRQGNSFADVVPVVGPRINTEQDFPPLENWPSQTEAEVIEDELDAYTRPEDSRNGVARSRTTVDGTSEEDLLIEPYGIDYLPGETPLPYEEESGFPTQETRSIPDAPASDLSEPTWQDEGDFSDGIPGTPIDPAPLSDTESFNTVPTEEEDKEKLETFPEVIPPSETEERSLPPREEEPIPQPLDPAFPEDFITPQ
ncbi:MAG: hypothetical protein AAFX78_17060 [Cyanobacteria bacterium J06638_20]